MSTFFEDRQLPFFAELHRFLAWFYGNRDLSAWNLEEVMGYLDLQCSRETVWDYEIESQTQEDTRQVYEQLLSYISRRLSIEDSYCTLHEMLFRELDDRDTIITMNYDLVADFSLRKMEPPDKDGNFDQGSRLGKINGLLGRPNLWSEPPPSLMPEESSGGFFLKLHGSLDWLHCTTPNCYNNVNFFCRLTGNLGKGQRKGRPCRYCGAALRMLIVPPVPRKHIEDRGRLAFLWHLAWRELIEADRVVVVGLSLPATDFELRWLIRYACEVRKKPIEELCVVNPSPIHQELVRECFPGIVKKTSKHTDLSSYLAANSVTS